MNDIFVHVRASTGDEFVSLDDWIREECVALAAGKDVRCVLDQAGVRGRDALRRLDAVVLPFALKVIDGVHRCLAAGHSLEAVGGALGARLVRAPRFDLRAPSLQAWVEIAAVNVTEAVLEYCDEMDLRGHARKKALEYATGEIQAALNGRLAEANERIDTLESAIVRHIATAQIDAGGAQIGPGLSPYIAGS